MSAQEKSGSLKEEPQTLYLIVCTGNRAKRLVPLKPAALIGVGLLRLTVLTLGQIDVEIALNQAGAPDDTQEDQPAGNG
jgi:hypothetical protein